MKLHRTHFIILGLLMAGVMGLVAYWRSVPLPCDWRLVNGLITPRWDHQALCLKDGRVLVLGGYTDDYWGSAVKTCELFDPVRETWSPAGALEYGCTSAVELPDGRVIATDNDTNNFLPGRSIPPGSWKILPPTWKIFDPQSSTWTPVISDQWAHPAYLRSLLNLRDGRILAYSSYEASIYNPSENSWSNLVKFPKELSNFICLADGRVLGMDDSSAGENLLFDPQKEIWSPGAPMPSGNGWGTLLPNGTIFYLSRAVANPTVQIYDPRANLWRKFGSPRAVNDQSGSIILTRLKSGNVLMTGEFFSRWEPWIVPIFGWSDYRLYWQACWYPQTMIKIPVSECDLFDWKAKDWKVSGPLLQPRMFHTTTLLKDGRVLVTGGAGADGKLLNTCEIGTITESRETP